MVMHKVPGAALREKRRTAAKVMDSGNWCYDFRPVKQAGL